MNGLFSGLLGGNKPMNITPQQGGGLFGGMLPKGMPMRMPNMGGFGPMLSHIGQNARSPMVGAGMGMMQGGWGGALGGIQNNMEFADRRRQQEMLQNWFRQMQTQQDGGLGGGGSTGGPAPASIY